MTGIHSVRQQRVEAAAVDARHQGPLLRWPEGRRCPRQHRSQQGQPQLASEPISVSAAPAAAKAAGKLFYVKTFRILSTCFWWVLKNELNDSWERHSTEVASALFTQLSWVRISTLPKTDTRAQCYKERCCLESKYYLIEVPQNMMVVCRAQAWHIMIEWSWVLFLLIGIFTRELYGVSALRKRTENL